MNSNTKPILVYRAVNGDLCRVLIEPSQITIMRAEGPTALCGKIQKANSYIGANAILQANARTAPKGGAYDKHDFVVIFANGNEYSGRYDLSFEGPFDLAQHMRGFINYYAGNWSAVSARDDIKKAYQREIQSNPERTHGFQEWLQRYDVGQVPVLVDPETTSVEIVADYQKLNDDLTQGHLTLAQYGLQLNLLKEVTRARMRETF